MLAWHHGDQSCPVSATLQWRRCGSPPPDPQGRAQLSDRCLDLLRRAADLQPAERGNLTSLTRPIKTTSSYVCLDRSYLEPSTTTRLLERLSKPILQFAEADE